MEVPPVPLPAQPINKPTAQTTNYGDILRELQATLSAEKRQEMFVADVPQPPSAPTTTTEEDEEQQPSTVQKVREPVVVATTVDEANAKVPVAKWIPPAVAEKTDKINKVLKQESESVLTRFRRHIFVAVVSFLVINYGSPFICSLPFLSSNALFSSLAMAISIGILYYIGDVFLLMPETIVTDSQ